MACQFEVQFPDGRCENGTEYALEALDLVGTLEEQMSFFRPTSQISRINLLAAEQPVEVEPALFELLRLAITVYQETGGAYDITSAPLWEAWGFARRAGQIPSDAQLAEAKALVGAHLVELDPTQHTVRFLKPGVRINLGSIGKGYALDVCGLRLRENGMTDFLLHGGQSSVLTNGQRMPGGATNGEAKTMPWEVGVRHPQQPGRRLGIVRLCDRAMGTSGGQFQSFRHRGRRYGHILDPRTGMPAEGVLSATVVASSAALADALSTAFYVLGAERSLEYCRTHPGIGAVMICPSTRSGGVAIQTAGLDDFELSVNGA
jgi:FAD:protein FMN transferase